jgi:hypothetical protein
MREKHMRVLCWMMTAAVLGLAGAGCGEDLGQCDMNALGGSTVQGMEAPNTAQSLVQQKCAGNHCHTASATGKDRFGAPADLDFDVQPANAAEAQQARFRHGADVVHEWAEDMWDQIASGNMPPEKQAQFDESTGEKQTVRNWLACGAPVISAPPKVDPTADAWTAIHSALEVQCASCHSDPPYPGVTFVMYPTASACDAYHNVVNKAATTPSPLGQCTGMLLVDPGKPDTSLLLRKIEGTQPLCGMPMPLNTPGLGTSDATVQKLRAWIAAGAPPPADCSR